MVSRVPLHRCVQLRTWPQTWFQAKVSYDVEIWCTIGHYVHSWNWGKLGFKTSWDWGLVKAWSHTMKHLFIKSVFLGKLEVILVVLQSKFLPWCFGASKIYIYPKVAFIMAQTILKSLVGPKRWKLKEVAINVDNFFIGAHGNFMQTRIPLTNVPKQARYHPCDTIPFVSYSLG